MRILEALEHGFHSFIDINAALLSPQTAFGHSLPKTMRYLKKRADQRERDAQETQERQRIRVIIAKLAHDNIIQKNGQTNWVITKAGKEKLGLLRERFFRKKTYEAIDEKTIKIVIFDIPECYRKHRNWIQSVLRSLQYEMLQKSVFTGTGKIPELFIADLNRLALLHYVQIFTVGKHGTLENYINAHHKK